jgi:REP element-mobilizing transposase RayT/DNA-binding response OmpR family regulator
MITLLVVTSDIPFGELIRQNLEETGRFHVRIAGEKESAVFFVNEEDCPLAFLDTCVAEQDLLEIGAYVRQANPNMRFVVVSEAGWHSALEDLAPADYLAKPFYLPDLLEMMDNFFPSVRSSDGVSEAGETVSDPPWLSDVTRAAQHLTRLTLESSAQAALITRKDQLWAYAGQLPESSTRELTDSVSRYWDRQEENDLVRFVHLASTGAEHMLYATRLTKNMVLALIFDAETPFSTIHTQANQLVHSLSKSPAEKQNGILRTDEEAASAAISASLSTLPSLNSTADTKIFAPKNLKESNSGIPINQLSSTEESEASIDTEKTVEAPAISWRNRFKKNGLAQDDAGETHTNPISGAVRKIILESASPSVYNLDYACLLVPRFPQHILIGDLSDRLSDWVQETCVAFGWRLEYISVRPEYLLWIVNVPPTTSPGYLMRIKRQRTSEKIFEEFPRFSKENPSGEFWAPGYLIVGGSQPPQMELIKEFIAQTRQRQGINKPLR